MVYITERYNCESPVDITDIFCTNPDFSEQLNVLFFTSIFYIIECKTNTSSNSYKEY